MDWLNILSLVISILGVAISLLLFNSSINNSRKILLSKVMYYINYDHEIMALFSESTKDKKIRNAKITKERVIKFCQNMFRLEEMLKEISYKNELGVPTIPEQDKSINDNEYKHIYGISETFAVMNNYFKKRNLPNFYLLLNEYDDRCYFLQHYYRKEQYIHKWGIGPIIGLKYIYKRKHVSANYGGFSTPLIKKIKNEKDFEKYYNECYCNMKIFDNNKQKQTVNREIENLEMITDKEHRIPIVMFR
ncbi:MAG: hypothetical protein PHS54_03170 [Clostridia bacterium]|nr:hypothetical protein [Clostridia bacterium]